MDNPRENRRGNQEWTIQRKPKGQSRMGNPEKLVTLGTQDEDKTKNTTQKTKKMNNMYPTKNRG
jgi:hypothetical protein